MATGKVDLDLCQATRFARWMPPTTSRVPKRGKVEILTTHRRKRIGRARSNKPCGPVPRKHCPSEKRMTDSPPARRPAIAPGTWVARCSGQPNAEKAGTGTVGGLHSDAPPKYGEHSPTKTLCALRESARSATIALVLRWLGLEGCATPYQILSSTKDR